MCDGGPGEQVSICLHLGPAAQPLSAVFAYIVVLVFSRKSENLLNERY